MKKIFTLLVGALMASNAFGQARWTTIFNQDLENDFADPNMEFFECSERNKAERGPVRIVEDPSDPTNHCIKVIVRSDAEAEAEGNRETESGQGGTHLISWDTQFFIYFKEAIPAGKQIRLTMNAKGEKEGSFQFQSHAYPQNYIHYQLFPNADDGGNTLSYKTEWAAKPFRKQDIVSSSASPSGNFQCIALNMTCSPYEGNVVYLDNIKVEIRDVPEDNSELVNFMRKGVFSDDPIDNIRYARAEGDTIDASISNFMIQVRDPQTQKNSLIKAPIVETGDPTHPYAVKVPTLNHKVVDEVIPDSLDEEGNPVTQKVYYWEDGARIGTSAPARYSSQFFVSTLHKMKGGEKFKFVFYVKADKPATIATQGHTLPTQYKDYNTFKWVDENDLDDNGKPKEKTDFPVSTEWTRYELGAGKGQTVPGGAGGCQTITFDTYILQEENNYYFVFEECSFSEQNVLISDRTLGEESIKLVASNDPEIEQPNTIDATGMLAAFDEENFDFLKNSDKSGVKLLTMTEPDDPEEEPQPTFTGLRSWTDGGYIDANGQAVLDDSGAGILLNFDDESIDGNKVNIKVYNDPEASGVTFANGVTVPTDFCVSSDGWYYIYHVTLMDEATAAGIQGVKVVKANNGQIYNLSGQRVDGNYKGLVIKNGQKTIQK